MRGHRLIYGWDRWQEERKRAVAQRGYLSIENYSSHVKGKSHSGETWYIFGRHRALTEVQPGCKLHVSFLAMRCGAPISNREPSRWASHAEGGKFWSRACRIQWIMISKCCGPVNKGWWEGKFWLCSNAKSRWVMRKPKRWAHIYLSILATCPSGLFAYLKKGSKCVCGLWSAAKPSQDKKRNARRRRKEEWKNSM